MRRFTFQLRDLIRDDMWSDHLSEEERTTPRWRADETEGISVPFRLIGALYR